ncbi:hypothetical protein UCREL1_11284 [Eutypa lata UCREL1]|uniref:Uncharacterized protein n=1 Tax=Eutypa lata (strain UCR-EL1) TaxID=1287681 RepID=M7S6T5_EUTLA|nr:hypothetical protein UCREL1_11284 [Eutypa lata UCREL1]
MQFITILVGSLAVFGIQAASIHQRDAGICGIDYKCHLNGVPMLCDVGICSEEGQACHNNFGLVDCN